MMDDENMVCDDSNRSEDRDSRTLALIGEEALSQLHAARVLVVGVGGVGGYAVEMLARTGVGHLTLIDADCVALSNLNRQLIALESTIGQPKTGLFASRILDINPDIEVDARPEFLQACAVATILDEGYDFVLDCIDTVAPKVALIAECLRRNIPLISSMGAGGRTDVSKVTYSDLWETREDGLARAVRQRLKKMGLRRRLTVVCSTEAPRPGSLLSDERENKRSSYGTTACVPATFGIFMASHALNRLTSRAGQNE